MGTWENVTLLHSLSPSSIPPVPASLPHSPNLIYPLPPEFSPSLLASSLSLQCTPHKALVGAPYPELTYSQPSLGSPATPELLSLGVMVLHLSPIHLRPSPSVFQPY